jgi:pyruvate dehydrogenase E2 component (dihydrolipoamide acetyltransferase)
MARDLKLPSLGEGAESGTVVKIHVREGETIQQDQTILEMENEKAVAPIPSSAAGRVVTIYVREGEELSVGDSILALEEVSEATKSDTAHAPTREEKDQRQEMIGKDREPEEEHGREEAEKPSTGRFSETEGPEESPYLFAGSPSVRKIARQLGIDLSEVTGSARGGRITLHDLRLYVHWLRRRALAEPKPPTSPQPSWPDFSQWGTVRVEPLSAIRKTIGRRMLHSWSTIPHVTQFDEACIDRLLDLKKTYALGYEKRKARLTLTALLVKAVVPLLKEFPVFNASLDVGAQQVVFKEYFNIGIATAIDHGLLVPVLKGANRMGLLEMAQAIPGLSRRAAAGELTGEEMKGGTFTITNQGAIGSGHFTPIIQAPEVAILGVGRARSRAVVTEGQLAESFFLPLALSYDHRLVDGAVAARFMVALVARLQDLPEDEVGI